MTMTAEDFREITKGHFFTVVFKKKTTGEIRTLNGLDRVKAYVKGTGKPVIDGRVLVWDRSVFRQELKAGKDRVTAGRRAYRSLWPETIVELRVGHKRYDSEGKEIN